MTALTDAAAAALTAKKKADADAATTDRQSRAAAARDRLRAVLADATGSTVFLSAVTLRDVDAKAGMAVFGDGTVFLAVTAGEVRLVSGGPGDWTTGPVLTSLADLGAALAAPVPALWVKVP